MHTLFRYLLLTLLCWLPAIVLQAAPQVTTSPTPSWVITRHPDLDKEPRSKLVANGAYKQLYDEQVNVDGYVRYQHYITRIVNQSGVQAHSELSFAFLSAYQQIIFHEVSITRHGQKINKLDKSKIKLVNNEDALDKHMLNGAYTALIILDDLRAGDVLEVAWSVKGQNPIYNNKYTDRFSFAATNPITNHYTSVRMPAGRPLYYKLHNGAPEPEKIEQDGFVIYDWPKMELESYDFSENTPAWYTGYPLVEVTEYANWQQVTDWALGVMNNYNYTLPPTLLKKIEEWKEDTDGSQWGFAERAVRFVQDEIRYMGIEIGINSHKPHTPAETFARRYGDCKDKSILLVTILRTQGIPAYVALVNTSLRGHVDEYMPSPSMFDHAVVKAEIDKELVLVDATIPMQRGRLYQLHFPDYGRGLLIRQGYPFPDKLSKPDHRSTRITETFDIPGDNTTQGQIRSLIEYKGGDADGARASFNVSSLKDIEEYFEEYYRKLFSDIELDLDIDYDDDSVGNSFSLHQVYNISNVWKQSNGLDYVGVAARPVYEKMVEPRKKSSDKPLAQFYPVDVKYTAIMQMPIKWSFADKGFTILRPSYSFSFEPTVQNNIVTLAYSFTTFKDHIPVAELEQYKEDYKRIVAALEYNLTRNQGYIGRTDDAGITAATGAGGVVNWVAVFLCLLSAVGTFFFLRHINPRSSELTSHTETPASMTWWLILLGLGLFVRIGIYGYSLITGNYFSTEVWMALNRLGNTGLQLLLMIQMVFTCAFAIASGWLFYWYFRQRDIFPRMFIIFAFSELAFFIFLLIMSFVFSDVLQALVPGFRAEAMKAVFRTLIFVALWVSVMHYSYRVKQVFIRPFQYQYPDDLAATVEQEPAPLPNTEEPVPAPPQEHNDAEGTGEDGNDNAEGTKDGNM